MTYELFIYVVEVWTYRKVTPGTSAQNLNQFVLNLLITDLFTTDEIGEFDCSRCGSLNWAKGGDTSWLMA